MPCVYLPGPAPAVTVANNKEKTADTVFPHCMGGGGQKQPINKYI